MGWGIDGKKRLDLLYEFICRHSEQQFLLVGRHQEHALNFKALPNVSLAGAVGHWRLPGYYRKMKMLYFPSERDPCPNTVVEAILSGVPVCYSPEGGGSVELTRDCGVPLECVESMLPVLPTYRDRCLRRDDLSFESVFQQYMDAAREV
ncbi:MAG: hypothetical protein JW384_02498 [Nitrosomonadaceae bacterium]|nr:hypothetical protein [Nitrosomonadaceae bacterium]